MTPFPGRAARLALAVVIASATGLMLGTPAQGAPAAGSPPTGAVAPAATQPVVQVLSRTPEYPSSAVAQPMSITVQLSNPTTQTFSGLVVSLQRGSPIITEQALQDALTTPPDTNDVDIAPFPVSGELAPGQTRVLVLKTTTGYQTTSGDGGLCLAGCSGNDGVYPVDVSLQQASDGTELARAHTYIPSFATTPAGVGVSWIWPLIDRPHRGLTATQFTNDDLATSVSPGGRLYRALQVAVRVAGKVHLTLVVDPELIDELSVMAAPAGYTVRTPTGSRRGTGGPAAALWLAQLKTAAAGDQVALTGYADPDVDAIAAARLSWSTVLDPTAAARVRTVLGAADTDLAWPAGGAVTSAGLDSLVANGVTSVVLADTALPGALGDAQTPDAVSPLPSVSGSATAVVLSTPLQNTFATLSGPTSTTAGIPTLLAQIAVRATENPTQNHYLAIAPGRYVDPDPSVVVAAMTSVADAPWADTLTVAQAVGSVTPADRGALDTAVATGQLSADNLATLAATQAAVTTFSDCLGNDDAATLLGGYPAAIQRGESSYWRLNPIAGARFARALLNSVDALEGKVRVAQPANSSYTLASSDAPLFVTLENSLPVAVHVRVQVSPAAGERGFRASNVAVVTIPAATGNQPSRHTVKIPTKVERSGRFKIVVTLRTPNGAPLGQSVPLRVHSTALGAVALWITGIAFGVLVLALVIRALRRLVLHRRRVSGAPGATQPA